MRTGRPKKNINTVNICISIDEVNLRKVDELRGHFSRGDFISTLIKGETELNAALIEKDDKIRLLELELKVLKKDRFSESEKIKMAFKDALISSVKHTLYAQVDSMPAAAKKFWAEKMKISVRQLKEVL